MKKSEDMIKNLAAQMAGQGMGIFLQARKEAQEEAEEYRTELMAANDYIDDLEATFEEMRKELDAKEQQISDLKESLKAAENDKNNFQRWWHEQLKETSKLKQEIEDLKDRYGIEDQIKEALA